MSVVIDTSAFYAILVENDKNHRQANAAWEKLLLDGDFLITTNYIEVETCALLQNRIGIAAVTSFQENIKPLLQVNWIESTIHEAAMNTLLVAGRRELSLVDCSTFVFMRQLGLKRVFAFDQHFAEQGFICVP